MSRVIVFCGHSGSGKTSLAQKISRKLNVACLHKDAVKERLYDFQGGKTLEDSNCIGREAILLILALAQDMIENKVDVILESPFDHPDYPKVFADWEQKLGVDLFRIICSAEREERLRRVTVRPRHPAHHDEERIRLGQYWKNENYDYARMPGKKLLLDTIRPLEELVKEVEIFLTKQGA